MDRFARPPQPFLTLCRLAHGLPRLSVSLVALCLSLVSAHAVAAEGRIGAPRTDATTPADSGTPSEGATASVRSAASVQSLVDDLRTRLAIPQDVLVSVDPENARLVSVERRKDREPAFLMSFETDFLGTLGEDELEAVIAHELGHVWIFTNHPYLQTEQLANRIAMRAVSRESLEKVYEKMWMRLGTKGELSRFLD